VSWFTDLFRKQAEDFVWAWLPDPRMTGKGIPDLEPNKCYLTVTVAAARIVHSRKLWKKLYPVAHTSVSVPHPSTTHASELRRVVSPADLQGVESDQLDRVIMVDQTVFGPVPYYGGELNLTAVLFGVEGADVLKPYVGLLDRISGLAGVQFITQAMPFANLLKEGTEQLTGLDKKSQLEAAIRIGLNPPRAGILLVVGAPVGTVDPTTLRVAKDGKVVKPGGKQLTEYPHLALRFTPTTNRPDWFSVPELNVRNENLRNLIRNRAKEEDVRAEFAGFRAVILTCADLLESDQQDLVGQIKKKVDGLFAPGLTTKKAGGQAELPPLSKYILKSNRAR
jgi:hypothetical protein